MIDLNKFCASQYEARKYLHKPFRTPSGIVRTNGHVLVCVPSDGGEYDSVESMNGSIEKFKASSEDRAGEWIDVSSIVLPVEIRCKNCGGSGHVYEEKCDECDGNGEFEHGSHMYECKECGGQGHVECSEHSESNKVKCGQCDGIGEEFQIVTVGHSDFQRRYLDMLVQLPGCKLRIASTPMETAVFTFYGGFGALMPCRK